MICKLKIKLAIILYLNKHIIFILNIIQIEIKLNCNIMICIAKYFIFSEMVMMNTLTGHLYGNIDFKIY